MMKVLSFFDNPSCSGEDEDF
jgi:hypothetical protein